MSLLDWALAYARRGFPVFPCDPRSKEPLVPRDIDPATRKPIPGTGGLKKATTDAAIIRGWWSRWPRAMIAIATGETAGVFVVDVDAGRDEDTGEEFSREQLVADLVREVGELPSTWAVGTPRGGVHLYFRFPVGDLNDREKPLGNRAGIIRRVDTRGEGGYVFAPPSQRADGRPYEWLVKPASADDRPAEAPAALLDCIQRRGRWASAHESSPLVAAPADSLPAGTGIADIDDAVRRYGLHAFDAEMKVLRESVKGQRNDNLFHAAIRMAQLVAAGALDRTVALAGLEGVAKTWPNFHKSRSTIESGFVKGLREPRDLSDVRHEAARRARDRSAHATSAGLPPDLPPASGPEDYGLPPAAGAAPPAEQRDQAPIVPPPQKPKENVAEPLDLTPEAMNLKLAFYPLTDLGNAERFRDRNRGKLLYCPQLEGRFLWWDGRRWNREGAEARVRIAEHDCVRAIRQEAEALRRSGCDTIVGTKRGRPPKKKALSHDEKVAIMAAALRDDKPPELPPEDEDEGESGPQPLYHSDLLERWARSSEDSARLSAVSRHGVPYLAVAIEDLDTDRFAFNVLNGTLHFSQREDGSARVDFRRHEPAEKITKLAPVVYDPNATCPRYDAFLAQMQPNAENRRFLQQWAGYSLTGDVREQCALFFWGKGRNGKSTLVDIWGVIAGDYGTSMPIATFLADGNNKQGGQATPDLAMLRGVRFARASEPDKGAKLGEALLKLVTGGEPFVARELHKGFFALNPQCKLVISGNYRPKIVGTDEGIWRRVRLVPWAVMLDKDQVDKTLGQKLAAEASGVLNRMLDGLRDWLENGLIVPGEVGDATKKYREDSDPLGRFLEACVVHEAGGRVQGSVMHRVFCAWCKANGEREWSPQGFGVAMSDRGYESKKSNLMWWMNLRLTKTVEDFIDAQGNPLRADAEESGRGGADDDVVSF